jgi:DNA polymerase-3 subunit alpha
MTHLHVHTVYSLLDGIIKPKELVQKVKDNGETAVAITDHGTVAGLVELHKEANKQGIKPILGMEAYHDRQQDVKKIHHLTLLARNREGYNNLIRLNNLAYENFYRKPRITDEMLREHGKGLIALTGCVQGYFTQSMVESGEPDVQWFKALSTWVDYAYIELMNHHLPGESPELNMVDWAMRNAPQLIVGTTDAHYLEESHARAHRVGLAISMNKREGDFVFQGDDYHICEPDLPEDCISNTDKVAALIESYDIGYEEWQLPKQDIDEEQELKELEFRLDDYFHSHFGIGSDQGEEYETYKSRLYREFTVIHNNGFIPYFKLVADICNYVDNDLKSLRGWGRGSAGGSLVAMLYGITLIDPIRHRLYFERFLNPDRITPPDIDLDLQPEDRVRVIEYMRKKYGGGVYQIGTFNTLSTREVIKSVSKAMGCRDSDGLEDYVPVEAPVPTIKELMTTDTFREAVASRHMEKFVEICMVLEGCPRNVSGHASGVVIDTAGVIPYRIAQSGVSKGVPVTLYDMYTLEDLKFTKFDILGVNMLSTVDRACKSAKLDLQDIPLDDQDTFDFFNAGNTLGVFQFETHSYSDIIKRLHPDTFEELVDMNTLGRPGCLESGMTDEYIERKFGRRESSPIHPKYNTGHQNLPLFQEQMMEISRDIAGFSMSKSDILRKAIGKKQKDLMESLKADFIQGCIEHSKCLSDEAEGIWDTIEKSARYTWNLSHAVCYTYVSYWTMYLACHYPTEFFGALLTGAENTGDATNRRRQLLSECRRREIPVNYPDVNRSEAGFVVKDGEILIGLSGIKYVGDKAVAEILKTRDERLILSSVDLAQRKIRSVTKRTIEYLLKAGCFPMEHIPDYNEEREALGYGLSGRVVDKFPYDLMPNVGEILEIKKITDRRGNPMAFIVVEYKERTESLTVFHSIYEDIQDQLKVGFVSGFARQRGEDILSHLFDPSKVEDWILDIDEDKVDDFLSFYPSLKGSPNIVCGSFDVASVPLDIEMVEFIRTNFGIRRILNRRCHY